MELIKGLEIEKKRMYEMGLPSYVIRLGKERYEVEAGVLREGLRLCGIFFNEAGSIVRTERIDNRPMWKKDLSLRTGKGADFKPYPHYAEIRNSRFLAEKIQKVKEKYRTEYSVEVIDEKGIDEIARCTDYKEAEKEADRIFSEHKEKKGDFGTRVSQIDIEDGREQWVRVLYLTERKREDKKKKIEKD